MLHHRTFLTLAMALCVTLAACRGGSDQPLTMVRETPGGIAGSFVGKVDGSDAFIALVAAESNRRAVAYVSDGRSLATWFEGVANQDAVSLPGSGGAQLIATISMEAANGRIVLADGRTLAFTSSPSTGEAGLYQAKKTLGASEHIGGWIVLADGQQRGTVIAGGSSFPPSPLIPSNPTVKLPAGTLEAKRIDP